MRAKAFTFKKTIKRTKTFTGLSIDLTVEEARELHKSLSNSWDRGALTDLFVAIEKFVFANEDEDSPK